MRSSKSIHPARLVAVALFMAIAACQTASTSRTEVPAGISMNPEAGTQVTDPAAIEDILTAQAWEGQWINKQQIGPLPMRIKFGSGATYTVVDSDTITVHRFDGGYNISDMGEINITVRGVNRTDSYRLYRLRSGGYQLSCDYTYKGEHWGTADLIQPSSG